eukprot:CAMPEP_0178954514 /NCGR_PEP_ID=MMETSP0789-20121207/9035_1 /TAXON_ID=3005 /ORGANISM="Rhizosolenia setigera, Strain CCMP 1694" /LENGTH=171 /DNA_ID=CAMNT_0020635929 /DNA_START=675 /DNA_END=1190 /DNA_ORIENTATION=-
MVTLFSAMTSVYYNYAIATKDTDIITNAVILLFVNEIDERLFQLAEACNYYLVDEVDKSFQLNTYHDTTELVINQGIERISSVFHIRKSHESIEENVPDRGRFSDVFSTKRTSQESIPEENVPEVRGFNMYSNRRISQDESIEEETVSELGNSEHDSKGRRPSMSLTSGTF